MFRTLRELKTKLRIRSGYLELERLLSLRVFGYRWQVWLVVLDSFHGFEWYLRLSQEYQHKDVWEVKLFHTLWLPLMRQFAINKVLPVALFVACFVVGTFATLTVLGGM